MGLAPAPLEPRSGSALFCPCCVLAGPGFGGSRSGVLPCAVSSVRLTNPNTGLSLSPSLKRTTDVMFGGKQVVVCGYGEVSFVSGSQWSCESACPRAILPLSSTACFFPVQRPLALDIGVEQTW